MGKEGIKGTFPWEFMLKWGCSETRLVNTELLIGFAQSVDIEDISIFSGCIRYLPIQYNIFRSGIGGGREEGRKGGREGRG